MLGLPAHSSDEAGIRTIKPFAMPQRWPNNLGLNPYYVIYQQCDLELVIQCL